MVKTRKTNNQTLKHVFELAYQEKISDSTWYRVKAAMKFGGMSIDEFSVSRIGGVKKLIKNSRISLTDVVISLVEIDKKYLNRKTAISGLDALLELKEITNHKARKSTLNRWFNYVPLKDGKRFSKTRKYSIQELVPVYLSALSYKLKYCNLKEIIDV